MKLLNEVGEKLYIMDLQSKDDTDYETFAQGIIEKEVIIDEIDPLEKVAKWRKDLNKPSNVPSGYGSNSTSPTPIVGCKKIVSSERSSFEERSPGTYVVIVSCCFLTSIYTMIYDSKQTMYIPTIFTNFVM